MARDAADRPVPPLSDVLLTRDELVRLGDDLGQRLRPPAVVSISGDLGAGKTTLVQALCRGYGVREPVTSPTFALVHEYHAERSPVFHLDLYRLAGPAELTNIGWDDILGSEAVVLIEWPERAGDRLPAARTQVSLAHVPGDGERRRVTVT